MKRIICLKSITDREAKIWMMQNTNSVYFPEIVVQIEEILNVLRSIKEQLPFLLEKYKLKQLSHPANEASLLKVTKST